MIVYDDETKRVATSDDSYIKTVIVNCHQPSFINNNNYYSVSACLWFIIVTGFPSARAGPVWRIHTNNNNISLDAVLSTSLSMAWDLVWNQLCRVQGISKINQEKNNVSLIYGRSHRESPKKLQIDHTNSITLLAH